MYRSCSVSLPRAIHGTSRGKRLFLTVQVPANIQLFGIPHGATASGLRFVSIHWTPEMTELKPSRRYRFGVFELDSATGELRRRGVRVKLNSHPFQVLLMLLERPGEMLTREEICRELWPDGTFVDYEHGMNSAVNRLREALGDEARNPRFVETLARRGYRFLAPVERIALDENASNTPGEISEKPPAVPAETRTRLLDRALAIANHEDLVDHYNFGVRWYIPARHYWAAIDTDKTVDWADEVGWYAVGQPGDGDECMTGCTLDVIVAGPPRYWTRFPVGQHIADALGSGVKSAKYAAGLAGDDCKPSAFRERVSEEIRTLTNEIRTSLAGLTRPEKLEILKSLDDIDRKCGLR
jgi:DNA-binding winged helix-turn-helix (wHTH) protein